ncbi:MAG: HlyD family type I secretion periplasmic adaptor subunit [Elainellaceae cyanobacterium]
MASNSIPTASDGTPDTTSARVRQTRTQFVNPEDYLSYELGKAVRQLPPLYTRLLAASISLTVFSVIAWAQFSKIDEVAVAAGELVPSAQVRPVRSLEGGVIEEILVEEGEVVVAGDPLVVQEGALPRSEVERLQDSTDLVQQDIDRLQAELAGDPNAGSPLQDELLAARLQTFTEQQGAVESDITRLGAAVAEAEARLTRLQQSLPNAQELLQNARDREARLAQLSETGAVAQFDYIAAKDRLTEARDRVSTLEQDIAAQRQVVQQAEQSVQQARQERDRLVSERRRDILTELNRRTEEMTGLEGQLSQAELRADAQVITAPITGRVYNIQATLAERTIEPGEELLSILPEERELLLEAKLLNRDIGFVAEGMPVKVKIDTFPFQEFGIVSGTVVSVSPNATVDQQLGPVFPVRIRLEETAIAIGDQEVALIPGMSATGEVVTRRKSVLTFMLEPITRRFGSAFSVR